MEKNKCENCGCVSCINIEDMRSTKVLKGGERGLDIKILCKYLRKWIKIRGIKDCCPFYEYGK